MNDHAHHDHAEPRHDDGHGHTHQPLDYAGWIHDQRAQKDAFFKESHHSPIPPDEREAFSGLAYYTIEPSLRFAPITLDPLSGDAATVTQIQTSDGAIRDGQFAGTFSFKVGCVEQRLAALRVANSDAETLFVPFRDATSGPETYGAGRYLDLEPFEDGTYDLDFNLAYAPFCAYSPSYSCPLPPPENWLSAPISAGERNG